MTRLVIQIQESRPPESRKACHVIVGVLILGYSNIVKLLVEISVLKHAKYTKIVTSKCEPVI